MWCQVISGHQSAAFKSKHDDCWPVVYGVLILLSHCKSNLIKPRLPPKSQWVHRSVEKIESHFVSQLFFSCHCSQSSGGETAGQAVKCANQVSPQNDTPTNLIAMKVKTVMGTCLSTTTTLSALVLTVTEVSSNTSESDTCTTECPPHSADGSLQEVRTLCGTLERWDLYFLTVWNTDFSNHRWWAKPFKFLGGKTWD